MDEGERTFPARNFSKASPPIHLAKSCMPEYFLRLCAEIRISFRRQTRPFSSQGSTDNIIIGLLQKKVTAVEFRRSE